MRLKDHLLVHRSSRVERSHSLFVRLSHKASMLGVQLSESGTCVCWLSINLRVGLTQSHGTLCEVTEILT